MINGANWATFFVAIATHPYSMIENAPESLCGECFAVGPIVTLLCTIIWYSGCHRAESLTKRSQVCWVLAFVVEPK